MNTAAPFSVLFLCTANSACSIMAEAVANRLGDGRVRALSAGSHPAAAVNPLALECLAAAGYPTAGLHSKSWDAFSGDRAPPLDAVITVCDAAAGEACPWFAGAPVRAHWGMRDPASPGLADAERAAAFGAALGLLERRIRALLAIPFGTLGAADLASRLVEIGRKVQEPA